MTDKAELRRLAIRHLAGLVQTSLTYSLFGAFAGKAAEKEKIRYVCKDCGKKFKFK